MKKIINRKKAADVPQEAPDLAGLINKILQQLASLERKIDALAGQRPVAGQNPPERRQENGFRERVLHKAICAECSKECEVPFRPSGDRPVYCKGCFEKRKNKPAPVKEKPAAKLEARPEARPQTKPEAKPPERVVVYERRFQRDQDTVIPKRSETKKPHGRRRR